MYLLSKTKRFERDVKACQKRHWDIETFKAALADLAASDTVPLAPKYRDHALSGDLAGMRAIHVPTGKNPPRDTWVVLYEIDGGELYLYRTGSHDEVYGRQ